MKSRTPKEILNGLLVDLKNQESNFKRNIEDNKKLLKHCDKMGVSPKCASYLYVKETLKDSRNELKFVKEEIDLLRKFKRSIDSEP